MTAAVITEIDSFSSKFKALVANGLKATLTLEADGSEVFATLKAGIGSNLLTAVQAAAMRETHSFMKRSRSPAYYRRQEKRKLERLQGIKAEQAKTVVTHTIKNAVLENADGDLHEAEKAKDCGNTIEETGKSNDFRSNLKSLKCDIFTFGYWSENQASTSDAVKQIEKSLIKSFNDTKIDAKDQLFEIYDAKHVDTNEVEVKVKVEKGFVMLKQAVKKIQTRYVSRDAFEISLIKLST